MLFIFGRVIGAALMWLVFWLMQKQISVRWYEWILGALGFMMAVWAIHDFFASTAEHNEAAARALLWILGAPAIILFGLAVFLPWRRIRHTKLNPAEKPAAEKT